MQIINLTALQRNCFAHCIRVLLNCTLRISVTALRVGKGLLICRSVFSTNTHLTTLIQLSEVFKLRHTLLQLEVCENSTFTVSWRVLAVILGDRETFDSQHLLWDEHFSCSLQCTLWIIYREIASCVGLQ